MTHEVHKRMGRHFILVLILTLHFIYTLQTTRHSQTEIDPLTATFEELVKGNFYADKTGFIEEFVSEYNLGKVFLITYPRKFGKSVNIQMLADYFQIYVDPASKHIEHQKARLFKELYVDKVEKLKNNFKGKHTVLTISLGSVSGASFQDMKETFIENVLRKVRTGVYTQYSYMMNVLEEKMKNSTLSETERQELGRKLNHFEKMHTGPREDITDLELANSFRFLSEVLHDEFGKKTFIFIDDYDSALNEAWFKWNKGDRLLILRFFQNLLQNTFEEKNVAFRQGVVTGMFNYAKENLFLSLRNVVECNMLHNPFYKYYGFTKVDVDELAERQGGISAELKLDAELYYDGYRTANDFTLSIFGPWATLSFLQHRVIGPYFKQSEILEFASPIFKHAEIWRDFRNLIDDGSVTATLKLLSIGTDAFNRLLEMVHPQCKIVQHDKDTFYKLLMSAGYLALNEINNTDKLFTVPGEHAVLRIPNRLVKMELSQKMLKYDPKITKSHYSAFDDAGKAIEKMFSKKNFKEPHKGFEKSFRKVLDGYGTFILKAPSKMTNTTEKQVCFDEHLIYSIVNGFGLSINAHRIGLEIPIKLRRNKADLPIIHNSLRKLIVFKFKRCEDRNSKPESLAKEAKGALEQAKKYATLFKETDSGTRHAMYVGIALSVEKNVYFETHVESYA